MMRIESAACCYYKYINMGKIKYYVHCIQWYISALYYELLMRTNMSKKASINKICSLLKFAQKEVPYYRNLLKGISITFHNAIDIHRSLPILTKEIIRREGNGVYASFVNDNWRFWHNTGGSTGEPLKFPLGGGNFADKIRGDVETIHQVLLYGMMGYSVGDHICSVDGRRVDDKNIANNIYWGYNPVNIPYGIEHFSTIYMSDDTISYYLDKLNEIKPNFLRGYPSGIHSLCKYAKKLNYKFNFTPKGIYLTSENFDETICNDIEAVFRCPVWGQYGHSEVSIFAYKKPNAEEYYCFPFYGYTEVLDDFNNPVSVGEEGNIIVTGFLNKALPFIRYATGDRAIYGGTLPDGTVVLKKLMGRTADYLIDRNQKKWNLVGLIFGGHLKAFNVISQWQLEQKEIGRILITIVPDKGFTESMESEILDFFSSYNFTAEIKYVQLIPKTERGKQKFLIQHLKV